MTTVPATLDEMFPSKYLKATDIHGEQIVTIKAFNLEKLPNRDTQEDEQKVILYFEELDKGMVLNKTNKNTLEGLYGTVIADLIGKRIILHTPDVEGFGKVAPAIRIKAQRPPMDRATLIAHYNAVFDNAKKAGIETKDYVISETMTNQEILDLGKELQKKVEAAKAFS